VPRLIAIDSLDFVSSAQNLKIAGLRFLLVLSEANKGYVRPSSVREAATATLVLCVATLSTASLRLDASAAAILDQPAPKEDPASYFEQLSVSFEKLVVAAEVAFA
jgi:hypothetical protein